VHVYPRALLLGTVSLSALASGSAAHAQSGVPNWAGGYLGLNAGTALHSARIQDIDDFLFFGPGSTWKNDNVTFTAGAQAGYLLQYGRAVVGIEADFNALVSNWRRLVAPDTYVSSEMGWLSTVRGRFGYVWGPLWYLTAGVAFTNITNSLGFTDGTGTITVSGHRTGFVYGGGIEDKISANWSLRLEVLFVDFGQRNGLVVIDSKGGPQTFRAAFKNSLGLIRTGINVQW
jgi:outer membrane immunogenic protein